MADASDESKGKGGALTVVAGSTNPVKISACQAAFSHAFPAFAVEVEGVKAPSGVSDQPMTDEETQRGAVNRARSAAELWRAKHGSFPTFAVGLEGGVSKPSYPTGPSTSAVHMTCYAWMAVWRVGTDQWGFGRTGSFTLPPRIMELVDGGMELGHADDLVFNKSDSKKKDGAVGLLTHGAITRTTYYIHALTLALVPFLNEALFFGGDDSAAAPTSAAPAPAPAASDVDPDA